MSCHPESRKEGDGELEDKSCDMGCKSDEAEVEDFAFEDEMIENIIEYPFQHQIQSATSCIAEQFEAHHLAEGWIEEIYDLGQAVLYP